MRLHIFCVALLLSSPALQAATVTIQGAQTNQVIDGFGVNANHRSWNNTELVPVLDALIDQAGVTIFRVIYDNCDWEGTNDNADSSVFNWDFYNAAYTSTDFTKLWDMVAYLNQRGITNGAVLNFMGYGPAWLCGSWNYNSQVLTAGLEDEWAEMITSALIYARNTRGLQFHSVMPNNEPDILREGIHLSGGAQYVTTLHKLAQKLDTNELADIRLIGPDYSSTDTGAMSTMMGDSLVMSKVEHFSTHGYSSGGGSAGVRSFLQSSAYPDRTFWQTEYNVWCATCDSGTRGTYDWTYCRGTAEYLLSHLVNGASAAIVYEGYDSYYAHHGAWGYWGLFSVDNENAAVKTYTPRKNFYTTAQVSKWVRPGAQRINISGTTSPFSPLQAFKHTGLGQITIVGVNTSASAASLSGTLASLPTVPFLNLYYTSATTNLASGGSVAVNSGSFSATIPADCVFTLVGYSGVQVTLTNPVNGAQFDAPATIPLAAAPTTTTGSIERVEFYSSNSKLGEATNEPYSMTWSNVPMGDYSLTARATDTNGSVGTSAVVNVTVVGSLAQITVSPPSAAVVVGGTKQFTATGADQLGHALTPQPVFVWSVGAGGTIGSSGLFTAEHAVGGPFNIVATNGNVMGTAAVNVTAAAGGAIGNASEGTQTDMMWNGGAWINASRFQAASNMTVTTMFAKVGAISGNYKCALYTGGSSQPNRILRSTTEIGNPASGWQGFTLSSPASLTNGSYYWLAIWSDNTNGKVYYSDTSATLKWGRYDYGTWPDPITMTGSGNLNYCIYAANMAASLAVTTVNLPSAKVGVDYAFQLSAGGGIAPYYWVMDTNAASPAGLTLATNGILSGLPDSAGSFYFPVFVTDSTSATAGQYVNLEIAKLIVTLGVPPQSGSEIASQGFKMTISADVPGTYMIQRSPDFSGWTNVQQVNYTSGVVGVTDSISGGGQKFFYRANRQ